MPIDFTSIVYSKPLKWIRSQRTEDETPWDELDNNPAQMPLIDFLRLQRSLNKWPAMDEQTWHDMVRFQKDNENKTLDLDISKGQALVIDGSSNNSVFIPTDETTCWQLYKKRLLDQRFATSSIDSIEKATLKILQRLSEDTSKTGPIKGLVIGNVQSGKTANMAALMAMAADWGWNMFIVLSGTIESLRLQTQERLYDDLNHFAGPISWYCLEHLHKGATTGSRAQDLHFKKTVNRRYFTVSLKNASRLHSLIQWLQEDRNKMKQMKILVIDDEADQAGINTANVDQSERTKINQLICALVNGLNELSEPIQEQYLAMNYIGYTATPYANILNESSRESLYPKNFIATLRVPDIYFGPQQIFGSPDGRYVGLDIIRNVPKSEVEAIKAIHKHGMFATNLPESFMNAVCWFVCCVAAMRKRGYDEPISMLVHTSQKVLHHANISDAVVSWINSSPKQMIIDRCRRVWDSETSQLSLDEFKDQYPDYGLLESVENYPSFNEIETGVEDVLSVDIQPIKLDDSDGVLTYHNGIHLCVDNSNNNGVNDENEHLRLVYPDKEHMPTPAPAFLVIGGATLSRGLTLKGLVCTFFLRSVKQADTLMQMGRWFGYRRKYELYPRVWLTTSTEAQFEFLSILDQELREEIHAMEVKGLNPEHYAARIRNTPSLRFLQITNKKRMQRVTNAEMDYSGSYNQTYLFDNDKNTLLANINTGKAFIESLGQPRPQKECNPHSSHAFVWENVPFAQVKDFLKNFHFCKNLLVFNDLNPLISWIEQITLEGKLHNWNVVLSGKKNPDPDKIWELANCSVAKVSRTRKNTDNENNHVINIHALRAPGDLITDVDLEGQPQEVLNMFAHLEESKMKEARMKAGLDRTPQLLLYMIDKDSKPTRTSRGGQPSRKALKAPCDILGVCVNIPGGATGANYVARVCIKLEKSVFNDHDINDEDAN